MNENTTPQIAGSQPNPAEIGIPSVAGKKTSPVKNRNLALMAALVVLMLVRFLSEAFSKKYSSEAAGASDPDVFRAHAHASSPLANSAA